MKTMYRAIHRANRIEKVQVLRSTEHSVWPAPFQENDKPRKDAITSQHCSYHETFDDAQAKLIGDVEEATKQAYQNVYRLEESWEDTQRLREQDCKEFPCDPGLSASRHGQVAR